MDWETFRAIQADRMLRFNSCYDATMNWEMDWHECPVCGASWEAGNILLEEDWVLIHKDRDLMVH
jgi:hypothetical protein